MMGLSSRLKGHLQNGTVPHRDLLDHVDCSTGLQEESGVRCRPHLLDLISQDVQMTGGPSGDGVRAILQGVDQFQLRRIQQNLVGMPKHAGILAIFSELHTQTLRVFPHLSRTERKSSNPLQTLTKPGRSKDSPSCARRTGDCQAPSRQAWPLLRQILSQVSVVCQHLLEVAPRQQIRQITTAGRIPRPSTSRSGMAHCSWQKGWAN